MFAGCGGIADRVAIIEVYRPRRLPKCWDTIARQPSAYCGTNANGLPYKRVLRESLIPTFCARA
jgi:hypothetical protein